MSRLIRGTIRAVLLGGGLLTLGALVPRATDAGLVGHWHFDEGEGTLTSDSSGNNNDGALSGYTLPTWSGDAAPIPSNPFSLSFDGTLSGSYFLCGSRPGRIARSDRGTDHGGMGQARGPVAGGRSHARNHQQAAAAVNPSWGSAMAATPHPTG